MPTQRQDEREQGWGTPYRAAWWGFELEGHRPGDGTYNLTSADWLPAPPAPDELAKMAWLGDLGQTHPLVLAAHQETLAPLIAQASERGFALPETFVRYFSTFDQAHEIRSCTDCYFELGEVTLDPTGQGYLIRFYQDSQGCLYWYLYIDPTAGVAAVVAGGERMEPGWSYEYWLEEWRAMDDAWRLEVEEERREEWEQEGRERGEPEPEPLVPHADPPPTALLSVVARSFEEFIWRVRIENALWFGEYESPELLTAEVVAYGRALDALVGPYEQEDEDE